jgi:hypothetical protein
MAAIVVGAHRDRGFGLRITVLISRCAAVVLQEPAEPLLADDFPGREGKRWRRIGADLGKWSIADALMRTFPVVMLNKNADQVP